MWENHHVYYFNKDGLPIIDESRHTFNKVFWSGYFLYHKEETIFVEYNNAVAYPDRLSWIEWKNGKKKSKHFFRLQYGSEKFISLSFPEFFARARSKEGSFLIWSAEMYNYSEADDKIVTADYISSIPGYGFYKAEKEYTYNEAGKVKEIKRKDHNGTTQIEYSRPEKGETLSSLIDELSGAFANAIIAALQKEEPDSPIALLDLSYRSVDNYVPYIYYATEIELKQFNQSAIHEPFECFSGVLWMKHQLEWNYHQQTEALYTRFYKRIDDTSNWNVGRKFTYNLALKLNTIAKITGKPVFSDTLFAYALDYEVDNDLDKIFIKCGASAKQVAKWKKEGKL